MFNDITARLGQFAMGAVSSRLNSKRPIHRMISRSDLEYGDKRGKNCRVTVPALWTDRP